MALAYFWRRMTKNIKENGRIIKEMDLIYTFGNFKIFMNDSGRMTISMDRDFIRKMGKHTKVDTEIISSREKEFFIWTMELVLKLVPRRYVKWKMDILLRKWRWGGKGIKGWQEV